MHIVQLWCLTGVRQGTIGGIVVQQEIEKDDPTSAALSLPLSLGMPGDGSMAGATGAVNVSGTIGGLLVEELGGEVHLLDG